MGTYPTTPNNLRSTSKHYLTLNNQDFFEEIKGNGGNIVHHFRNSRPATSALPNFSPSIIPAIFELAPAAFGKEQVPF